MPGIWGRGAFSSVGDAAAEGIQASEAQGSAEIGAGFRRSGNPPPR